jgi:hypothetical protein
VTNKEERVTFSIQELALTNGLTIATLGKLFRKQGAVTQVKLLV